MVGRAELARAELARAELIRAVREQAALDLVSLMPAGGESGAAFWARERRGGTWMLKIAPGPAAGAVGPLHELEAVTGRLRDRGYPAPRIRAVGQAGGSAFWITERLPGRVLAGAGGPPGYAAVSRFLPDLFRLNDAQAGLGSGGAAWGDLITRTLVTGGEGYCLHSTLAARPDTRELLAALRRIGEKCGPALPPGVDFTHFDFQFMNLLSDGETITGVVDVNPPPVSGDRAFDLATLAFYVYDVSELRRPVLARLSGLASWAAARAYLAHMVLRQVEWSVRHHPAAAATRHHLSLARLILRDIGADGPGRGCDALR
jgi:aminoglycoside phosphotransferase (APT) family kinase protein